MIFECALEMAVIDPNSNSWFERVGSDGEPGVAGGPFVLEPHFIVIFGHGRHERRSARPRIFRGQSHALVCPAGFPVGDVLG